MKQAGRPPNKDSKVCRECGKRKGQYAYYKNSGKLSQGEGDTINICKDCLKKMCYTKRGAVNVENFKSILRQLDKPFDEKAFEKTIEEAEEYNKKHKGRLNIMGIYLRNITSMQSLTNQCNSYKEKHGVLLKQAITYDDSAYENAILNFQPNQDMIDLFGGGFSAEEYYLMNKKYEDLKINYPIKTNMHKEFLVTYVKCKVKEEIAIADGNIDEVNKWSGLASKAAENAKITPKQLTSADLQGGLSSFSEIFEAVEGAKDLIKILPRFKQQPNDMPDFIMWNEINYIRDLENEPLCSYEDIYKFYDIRKDEYIQEHGDIFGVFADDNSQSEEARKSIKKFITVVKDQYEGDDDE